MKTTFFLTLLLGFNVYGFCQVTCDCTTFPFKPHQPCYERCIGKILKKLPATELVSILQLDSALAYTIVDTRDSALTLRDFQKVLTSKQFNNVSLKMSSLSDDDFKKVKKSITF